MKKLRIGALLAIMMVLTSCANVNKPEPLPAEEKVLTFKIGMAIADITPDKAVYLEGYEGHDEYSLAKPGTFTSDLKARIMVVDNGTDRLVFINVEQVFSGWEFGTHTMSEGLIKKVAETCQTSTGNILLSNTHDHQSYMTLGSAQEDNIAAAVAEAYGNLAPAKIGTGSCTTDFGASRGNNYTLDLTKPYDGTMNVIRFDNAETGEPIGLIYSVPMHNTLFGNGPGLRVRHNLLSCEFTGYASRAIEDKMKSENAGFVAMHINGFYGNTTGMAKGKYYAEDQDELIEIGGMFAEEILSVYDTIVPEETIGTIKANKVETTVPTNKTDKTYKNNFGNHDDMPTCIKVGAFGDIAYLGVNYEPFSVIATRLKAESPYSLVLPAGNVNGWLGYVPTKETFEAHKTQAEAECGPYKSPFDEDSEEYFYAAIFGALCDLAEVTPSRTEAVFDGVETAGKASVYSFRFEEPVKADKLVISFGQTLRTDCASVFDVVAYDAQGATVLRRSYTDNGDNYVGIFTENAEITSVKLLVKERFGKGATKLDSLPVSLHTVDFTEK